MVDDKDNPSPDPWAGIDDDGSSEPAEEFSFSLDATGEPAPELAIGDLGDLAGPDSLSDLGDLAFDPAAAAPGDEADEVDEVIEELEIEEAVFPMPHDEAPAGDNVPVGVFSLDTPSDDPETAHDDPFAVLAAGTDLPEFPHAGTGADADSSAETDMVEEWLEEPVADGGNEPPFAVFPGDDVHEQGADADADGSTIQSSAIQIGTGKSGIVSSNDVISLDDWSTSEATSAPDLPGSDAASGIESDDELLAAFGGSEFTAPEIAPPEFAEESFGAGEFGGAVAGGALAAGVNGFDQSAGFDEGAVTQPVAAPVKKKSKPVKNAKAQGGGIGQMLGIVLGGAMAIPLVFGILVGLMWAGVNVPVGRAIGRALPESLAFLVPENFRPGFKKPLGAGLPKLDQAASLDSLPQGAEGVDAPTATDAEPAAEVPVAAAPADEAVAESAPPAEPAEPAGQPAAPADDLFTEEPAKEAVKEPAAPAVPEPEPLDFSALEAAIAQAETAYDELALVDAEDPVRKKVLVGWYKNLAGVAEQLVMLETAAADSARPLDKTPEQMEGVYAKIIGNDTTVGDIGKLSGMWLKSKKRPVDGAVLLATFNGVRQVGPYWSSSVTIDGAEPKSVTIISRREPTAAAGEQVLVTGVLFDGDVVWAADCRSLEQAAKPVEDLF